MASRKIIFVYNGLGVCVVASVCWLCGVASHYANTMLNAVVFICVIKVIEMFVFV